MWHLRDAETIPPLSMPFRRPLECALPGLESMRKAESNYPYTAWPTTNVCPLEIHFMGAIRAKPILL